MNSNRVGHEAEMVPASVSGRSFVISFWWRIFVVVGATLLALGAIIALVNPSMLISPQDEITHGVRIYAGYLAVRNLALGVFLLLLLSLRARRALGSLMMLVGLIQILDVVMDCIEGRWAIVPGVLVLGILYLIGAARVSGAPFWRRESWV